MKTEDVIKTAIWAQGVNKGWKPSSPILADDMNDVAMTPAQEEKLRERLREWF